MGALPVAVGAAAKVWTASPLLPDTRFPILRRMKLSWLVLGGCALAACDTQAGTDYRGEPLLSVTGSVVLTHPRVDGPLVPAIAFLNGETELHFLDVDVQGEFPSSFTFHVYKPPPEAALSGDTGEPDEPRWAVGYITAVPKVHVASVQTGVPMGGGEVCTGDDVCRTEVAWCTLDEQDCYVETTVCAHVSSTPECTTEVSGSPELRRTVFSQFEGLALSYRILYLKTAAPAGSDFALEAGAPEGLAAGYHLFRLETDETPSPEARQAAYEACERAIRTRAVELYNEQNETALTVEAVYEAMRCIDEPCEGVSEATYDAVHELESAAVLEVSCVPATETVQRIEDPLNQPISIVIGPGMVSE